MKHLLFYDGECGLCDWVVSLIIRLDKKEKFAFAPLQGKTAKSLLNEFPEKVKNVDTQVLIENYQEPNKAIYFYGKGALRVFWLLGGFWKLLGLFSYLPAPLVDGPYRFIAKHRHRFFSPSCLVKSDKTRFLP